ncbi:MAG: hypothetical protein KatS3mg112_1925 [Thermogutta sp.]|nr:MAG: hypothetical protein KatS3mg112_1925 [Thermogutta sp.]
MLVPGMNCQDEKALGSNERSETFTALDGGYKWAMRGIAVR